ncbi:MAG: hypothetical protein MSC31_12615 [Solirubrobacteraceae bacterium MAG38_C4-C5]|nr:hypothetical protein [Candidatus Siliceabacter maunaloa]
MGRHVNVFDPSGTAEQWGETVDTAEYVVTHPVESVQSVASSFWDPIAESYEQGGLDEALGRGTVTAVGTVVGGKGLPKLSKLDNAVPDNPRAPDRRTPDTPEGAPFTPLSPAQQQAAREWRAGLPSRQTPVRTPADRYEVEQAGPDNFEMRGGDVRINADGFRETDGSALEVKHVGSPDRSPYVPGSGAPDFIRQKALADMDSEMARYRQVIEDGSNPVRGLEVITNDRRAVPQFEEMLRKHEIPGRVVVREGEAP